MASQDKAEAQPVEKQGNMDSDIQASGAIRPRPSRKNSVLQFPRGLPSSAADLCSRSFDYVERMSSNLG